MISLSFSWLFRKIILNTPSLISSLTNLNLMLTCLVYIKIAPRSSTQTTMGKETLSPMLSESCATNIISFTASESTVNLASELKVWPSSVAFSSSCLVPFSHRKCNQKCFSLNQDCLHNCDCCSKRGPTLHFYLDFTQNSSHNFLYQKQIQSHETFP